MRSDSAMQLSEYSEEPDIVLRTLSSPALPPTLPLRTARGTFLLLRSSP